MRVSLFKRKKTFWIRYTYQGKQYRESLKTHDPTVARRLAKHIEKQLILGMHAVPDEKTPIDSFLEQYFPYAEAHKSSKTVLIDRWAIKELGKRIPIRYLQDVTPNQIENFKCALKDSGLSSNSINIHLRHLSSIFGVAVKWGLLRKNPFSGIPKFKVEKNPPRFLSKDQIEKVLSIAQNHGRDITLVFLLGIYAGLRRNEIANARWEWFDFDHKTLTLSSYGDFHLKDYECRTIPLHSRLADFLASERQDEGYLFIPEKQLSHWRYRYEFRTVFNTVCLKAELTWVTPHILRHTFASHLAISGVSLYKISKWLGHSNYSTTQIYAHLQAGDDEIEKL